MDEIAEKPPKVTILGALGRGFLTAIASGMFGSLLVVAIMIAGDLGDGSRYSIGELLGQAAFALVFSFIFAIGTAIVIAWLPISLVGWVVQKLTIRFPIFGHWVAYALIGGVAGIGLIYAFAVDDPSRDESLMLFGSVCGIFAALFYRKLSHYFGPPQQALNLVPES